MHGSFRIRLWGYSLVLLENLAKIEGITEADPGCGFADISFNKPERIGLDFNAPHLSDILWIVAAGLKSGTNAMDWGFHEKLLKRVPGFPGEVMSDEWGIIYGRLEQLN